MQAKIAETIEQFLDYKVLAEEAYETSNRSVSDAIATSVANTANLIGAKAIFCFSETGRSGARISKARPICPIFLITDIRETALNMNLYWGVNSIFIRHLPQFIEDMEAVSLVKAHDVGLKAEIQLLLLAVLRLVAVKQTLCELFTLIKLRIFKDETCYFLRYWRDKYSGSDH